MEMQTATISGSLAAAGAATEDDYGDRVSADGQWKCVRPARHPGSCCGTSSSWYYGKYARVFANAQCRRLPSQLLVPAACSRYIVMPFGLASAMENGECSPGSLPTQLGPGEGPMFYLRVWGTMHRWRRWRTKKIYTSSSLRGSDA